MALPRALSPAGVVLVDKEPGPSSFAIVRRLRNRTGARAGHAGTLDPFASGLLLVFLGAATKVVQRFVGLDKRYLTDVDLTATSTTGDPEGELSPSDPPEDLEALLGPLRGEIELQVPAFSAVKVGGQRAYKLARSGEVVEMPVRRSTVRSLELVSYDGRIARLDMLVSSGTYVRAIAEALGGHCVSLRRTEVGPFRVEDADEELIVPVDEALARL